MGSVELLDECSSLVSTKALRKRHDDDIAVFPCTLGEPVCRDVFTFLVLVELCRLSQKLDHRPSLFGQSRDKPQ